MNFQLFLAGFLLVSVWIVALLSALDVLIDFRRLGVLRQSWTPLASPKGTGVVKATVAEAKGPAQAFAVHHLEQRVRALDQPNTLGFWDRKHGGELFGGALKVGDATVAVAPQAVELWPAQDRQASAHPVGAPQFAALMVDAQKAAGALRQLDTSFVAGDTVWVGGTFDGAAVTAGPSGKVLVSAVDPNAWAAARQQLCLGFVALSVGWAGLGTFLAVAAGEPWGLLSKAGAVVLIALFLGLTPLCVKVRNACRTPEERDVGGTQTLAQGTPTPA